MDKGVVIGLVIVGVLVVGGIGLTARGNNLGMTNQNSETEGVVKEFSVEAANFSYNSTEIRVKKGERVKITLTSQEGNHDLVFDEFNARTSKIGAGISDSVMFVADKIGTFEYYCSVGNHRAMGMVGKLIVE